MIATLLDASSESMIESSVIASPYLDKLINLSDKLNIAHDVLDGLSLEAIEELLQTVMSDYWTQLQTGGFGLSQLDDLLVLFTFIRLILLSIRYNIITGAAITAISVTAAYLWYTAFFAAIATYQQALGQISFTQRLAHDAFQVKTIMKSKMLTPDYSIRLTNPVGIIVYAIGNGITHEGHRIDPLSMMVSNTPAHFKDRVFCWYYLFYSKYIPLFIFISMNAYKYLTSVCLYAFVTRVNKRYCPYLVRWHWTSLTMFRFFEPHFFSISYRMVAYAQTIIFPQILSKAEYNVRSPILEFEMTFFMCLAYSLIFIHLGFLLYAMFHAICGQYFYIPFLIENVELHIGKRSLYSIYSGGWTAWQDPKERERFNRYLPKLWYGWFGRGTKKPSVVLILFKTLIYRPIYRSCLLYTSDAADD